MHSYSVEPKDQRAITIFFLAVAAILISFVANDLVNQSEFLKTVFTKIPLFSSASPILVFVGLYYIYDKWIWKLLWNVRVFRSFGIGAPVIGGYWSVNLESTQNTYGKPLRGHLFIDQRWTKIDIRLDTDISNSRSLSASIDVSSVNVMPSQIKLVNQYITEPKPSTGPDVMQTHEGTNTLVLSLLDGSVNNINGKWYTEWGVGGHGIISLIDSASE